ncbi:hypothetical protein [Gordonia zhaorongruii]|uniref:hypothetical protein n=1 Tax=Gordonia zhaorongruii TaxID=2597659 RepID=UPI00104E2131|nr:hypothetical protein [Gordonia zhaorongruii]
MTCDGAAPTGIAAPTEMATPTGFAAVLDKPVGEVLTDLGVPRIDAPLDVRPPELPDFDLPALPILPGVDPVALIKPITDLLGTFGTGILSGPGDPVRSLASLAGLLENGASTLMGAASAVDGQWLGQGASAAIGKATRTAADSGALAAQGAAMSTDVQVAAGIVAAGLVQLQGVVVKTVGMLAAAAPTLATPPGQLVALGIAAEGLAEGLAVVGATRAQLAAPTAHLGATGSPVPITGAPGAVGGDAVAGLLQQAGPLLSAGVRLAGSLFGGAGSGQAAGGVAAGLPATAPGDGGTQAPVQSCCAPCDRAAGAASSTGGASATGAAKGVHAPASAPAVGATPKGAMPASVMPTGAMPAASPVGAVTGVAAVSEAPVELAARPTTSNASAAVSGETGPAVVQAAHAQPAATGPMAPLAATGALRGADAPLRTADAPLVQTPVEEQPDADSALLLDGPFGIQTVGGSAAVSLDLALRLDSDLAGSV